MAEYNGTITSINFVKMAEEITWCMFKCNEAKTENNQRVCYAQLKACFNLLDAMGIDWDYGEDMTGFTYISFPSVGYTLSVK